MAALTRRAPPSRLQATRPATRHQVRRIDRPRHRRQRPQHRRIHHPPAQHRPRPRRHHAPTRATRAELTRHRAAQARTRRRQRHRIRTPVPRRIELALQQLTRRQSGQPSRQYTHAGTIPPPRLTVKGSPAHHAHASGHNTRGGARAPTPHATPAGEPQGGQAHGQGGGSRTPAPRPQERREGGRGFRQARNMRREGEGMKHGEKARAEEGGGRGELSPPRTQNIGGRGPNAGRRAPDSKAGGPPPTGGGGYSQARQSPQLPRGKSKRACAGAHARLLGYFRAFRALVAKAFSA